MQTRRIQPSPTDPSGSKNGSTQEKRDEQVSPDPESAERTLREHLLTEKDALITHQGERIAHLERSVDFFQSLTHRHQDLLEKQLVLPSPAASNSVVQSGLPNPDPRKDNIVGSFWGGLLQQSVSGGLSLLGLWAVNEFRQSHDHVGFTLLLAATALSLSATGQLLTFTLRRKRVPQWSALLSSLMMVAAGSCVLALFLHVLWLSVPAHPAGHRMFFQVCGFEAVLLTVIATTAGTFRDTIRLGRDVWQAARKKEDKSPDDQLRQDPYNHF